MPCAAASPRLSVTPPLSPAEVVVLSGLAGTHPVRRLWPGQPGPRSPWLPCPEGCCLVPSERRGVDHCDWLRFLVREVLAPRARAAVVRAEGFGMAGGHVVAGRAVVPGGRLTVASNRVRAVVLAGAGGAAGNRDR